MDPVLLQKQLRDNSSDLQEFCKDLKDWSNEMKHREESLKRNQPGSSSSSKIKKDKKCTVSENVPIKSSKKRTGTDYAAWDKFDAEKECERIDKKTSSESESELTDEFDESSKDEAMLEKEKGNKFVKAQNWDAAIKCYTKAIGCYGYDPVFYANRALCFLKKEKWKEVEVDCTTALQLDKTYVKAYQRRAAARVKLNQLEEAKADLEEVLKYEPKNPESNAALRTLKESLKKKDKDESKTAKPVSKFTQSRQNKKSTVLKSEPQTSNFDLEKATVIERKEGEIKTTKPPIVKDTFSWPEDDSLEIIEPISKAPHLRSKVPLKRIQIKEIETKLPPVHTKPAPIEKLEIEKEVASRRDSKKKSVSFSDVKENLVKVEKVIRAEEPVKDFVEPITSVQFFAQWKQFNDDINLKYEYLKVINPRNLKEVFKESLDSKTFSDILKVLSKYSHDHEFVYNFLVGLADVKRFCTLVFFMTKADKDGVKTIVDSVRTSGNYSEDNVKKLLKSFDL